MKLDGKMVAGEVKEVCAARVKSAVDRGLRKPKLAIIQTGDNPASNTYVKHKMKDCEEIGAEAMLLRYPADWKDNRQVHQIRARIQDLNADDRVDGIMIQLPLEGLKSKYYATQLLNEIVGHKDVDGLRASTFGILNVPFYYCDGFLPCTPRGIMMLLDYYGYDLVGMPTLVIGRSQLVGRPLAQMLLNRDAELTIVHSKCDPDQIWQEMNQAKLIISCVGSPGKWDAASEVNIAEHPILIDVGTSVDPTTGKLVGDFRGFDFLDHYNDLDKLDYTPVPGGVGPMTRAALMENLVDAWERHLQVKGELLCQTKDIIPEPLKAKLGRWRKVSGTSDNVFANWRLGSAKES